MNNAKAVNLVSPVVFVLSLLLLAWFLVSHSYPLQADGAVTSVPAHFVVVPLQTQVISLAIAVALFSVSLFIRLRTFAAGSKLTVVSAKISLLLMSINLLLYGQFAVGALIELMF